MLSACVENTRCQPKQMTRERQICSWMNQGRPQTTACISSHCVPHNSSGSIISGSVFCAEQALKGTDTHRGRYIDINSAYYVQHRVRLALDVSTKHFSHIFETCFNTFLSVGLRRVVITQQGLLLRPLPGLQRFQARPNRPAYSECSKKPRKQLDGNASNDTLSA